MGDYDEEIPDEDKVQIASDFIMHAPPGEFNEVFNDVRVLLDNDDLLKQGASAAFTKYNHEQFTPATLGEGDDAPEVLITEHGLNADGTYSDPENGKVFSFDHLRKVASEIQDSAANDGPESYRVALQKEAKAYTAEHYPAGITTVYGKGKDVIVCIEDHKFQPRNFWNGRWRSQWTFNTSTGAAVGILRVQVHYYEDGNVQLQSEKTVNLKVDVGSEDAAAKKLFKSIASTESEYQSSISENYVEMSDTTFKALRRALPITRQKVDWNKIMNYKVGKELANMS